MIRLRHLLAQRTTNPTVAALLLLVVAFRLLFPSGLMVSAGTDGTLATLTICSGHGPLFDGTGLRSLDPAARAAEADLTQALTKSAPQPDQSHSGDVCPYSAILAIGLAAALLLSAWILTTGGTQPPRPIKAPFSSGPRCFGPLGARAPPLGAPR